jgi:nitrite reductase (NADH) small subunit
MARHHIGTIDEFPADRATRVEVDNFDIAVFNIDGDLYGIQNLCPHKNLPLHVIGEEQPVSPSVSDRTQRKGRIDEDELSVNCPWHYLEWDLETGHNPVKNMSLPTYDIEVEGGDVYLEI